MKKILKQLKLIALVTTLTCIVLTLFVIISVQAWTHTEAGKVPPKTAVLLHAVHNNLVTANMKPPSFLAKSGKATYTRENLTIPISDGGEIPLRIYKPIEGESYPVIIYYHGGAFMEGYGSINTHDNIIRSLAGRTKSIVIAVGYRVAPKHPFPAAIEDSYDALVWARDHAKEHGGDPERIAVVGDSAGGNLATVVSLMSRDRGGPNITAQALLYPLTTFLDVDFASREEYDSGYYLLSRNVMLRARELYTPDESMWALPYTSPLEATHLYNLPPALVITAEFDPLRDEGEAYAKRLSEHRVPVRSIRYNGVMHGFVSFYEVMYRGNHGLSQTASFLNQAFKQDIPYESYQLHVFEGVEEGRQQIQEEAEAYAIGSFLIGKKALTFIPFIK
ncbi:alpha/beta hydrolase [Bacillus solitudinis]|uniref:alpha/beta hydrolase n=1 Tax=Bacillus solitudinis TaxID=2014074 RepID=UPI000C230B58|nr:alpha/beta hydrolase [Bacillus solitudinis]